MNNLVICEVDLELSLVRLIEIASCQVEEINFLILFWILVYRVSGGSAVVEYSAKHAKVQGSKTAHAAGQGR